MKALTKVAAFFLKEFHDVRRQPRLLLSLVGGPLLVLAAFAELNFINQQLLAKEASAAQTTA